MAGTALTAFLGANAQADLIIDIPDIPGFTLSEPITSTEPLVITAGASTDLIIDANITAPELTITAGSIAVSGAGVISVAGSTGIGAVGINIPLEGTPGRWDHGWRR